MKNTKNKRGFTLVEILTAVIIVAILTVMAMPLYEKTIERSRLAEARTIMNRLQAAKLAAMENMGCDSYSSSSTQCPKLQHLNVAFTTSTGTKFSTKDFTYSLVSSTYPNGICAKRLTGDYAGTIFAYYGLRQDGGDAVFACKGTHCEDYGFDNTSSLSCTF